MAIHTFLFNKSSTDSGEILDITAYKELDAMLHHIPAFTLRLPRESAEFIVDRLTKLSHPWNRYSIV
jgi:hypothetical protein